MQLRQLVLPVGLLIVICILTQPATAIIINGNETDDGTYYYNLGTRFVVSGEFERAVNAFNSALASNTTMIQQNDVLSYVYRDKAFVLIQLGRFGDAVDTANQGLSLYPKDVSLWNNKGYALFKLGQYNDAIQAYDQALAIEKDTTKLSKYWTNKGEALYSAGNYPKAVDAFQKALQLNPSNTDAVDGFARANQKASEISPALIVAGIAAVTIICGAVYYIIRRRKANTPD
jgi:tetratricopeptide (TPR) repeat protein